MHDNAPLLSLSASELLAKFGAGMHKPGSGSAVALEGLLAAHLLRTVINLTTDPKRAEQYADHLLRLSQIDEVLARDCIPKLELFFEQDAHQFHKVILLRQQRDDASDPVVGQKKRKEAVRALLAATVAPVRAGEICIQISEFALEVFDTGFKSARGDSGVALNAALSAAAGSLSVISLNLLKLEAGAETQNIRASSRAIYQKLEALLTKAQDRLSIQIREAERIQDFHEAVASMVAEGKRTRRRTGRQIEQLAIKFQRTLWNYRDIVLKTGNQSAPFEILIPSRALKSLGYVLIKEHSLGFFASRGKRTEIAGMIDQASQVVSLSEQFPLNVQNFTAAHELAHSLLHRQPVLHRDRPLDGSVPSGPRNSEEWEADRFAACFLMPAKLVKHWFKQNFLIDQFRITANTAPALRFRTPDVLRAECSNRRGLARLLAETKFYGLSAVFPLTERFNVSSEAMAIRLEELSLVEF